MLEELQMDYFKACPFRSLDYEFIKIKVALPTHVIFFCFSIPVCWVQVMYYQIISTSKSPRLFRILPSFLNHNPHHYHWCPRRHNNHPFCDSSYCCKWFASTQKLRNFQQNRWTKPKSQKMQLLSLKTKRKKSLRWWRRMHPASYLEEKILNSLDQVWQWDPI